MMTLKKRRTLASGGLALAFAIAGAVNVVLPMQSAEALTGCYTRVDDHVSTWGHNVTYATPDLDMGASAHSIRLVGNLMYWNCPNGVTRPDKFKGKWVNWCWTWDYREEHFWFDGARFDLRIIDDKGNNVSVGNFTVPDNGNIQNCRRMDIPLWKEQWMFKKYHPRWKVWSVVRLAHGWPDSGTAFVYAGTHTRPLSPIIDLRVNGWHN